MYTLAPKSYLTATAQDSRGCTAGLGCACTGMGSFMDGTGFLGSGLFVSSDWKLWGIGEWAACGVGLLLVFSVLSTGRRAARGVGSSVRRIQTASRKRTEARARRLELEAARIRGGA